MSAVIRKSKPDFVFHLAAEAIVRDCYDSPKAAFDVNVGGTVNVLEAVRTSDSTANVIIVTSDKCYENTEQGVAFKESDRLGGHDPYSASKACAELVTHAYARSYFTQSNRAVVTSGRAGNVIGGGDWAPHRLVPDCLRALQNNETLVIRSPQAVRPWQHVLESLSGYLTLAERMLEAPESMRGESFNFGPRHEHHRTVADLLQALKSHWPQLKWRIELNKDDKKEAGYLQLDATKAESILGWRPSLTFDQSIEMTASWYQEYLGNTKELKAFTEDQIDLYS